MGPSILHAVRERWEVNGLLLEWCGAGNILVGAAWEFTMMKRSTKDRAKGAFHEVKGTIKDKLGKLTNNSALEAKGKVEKFAGKIQKKIGQVRRTFERS
jgi:uncharacterized protein YjbJ (UPF0337 family)